MDADQFDDLTVRLGSVNSRRGFLSFLAAPLAALSLAALDLDDADAHRKKRRKKKKKRPKRSPTPSRPPALPTPTAMMRFLVSRGGIWVEEDYDGNWTCHIYDFKIQSQNTPTVIRYTYPWDPWSDRCRWELPTSASYGSTWWATSTAVSIQFGSGGTEHVTLRGYAAEYDAFGISRPGTGNSFWLRLPL